MTMLPVYGVSGAREGHAEELIMSTVSTPSDRPRLDRDVIPHYDFLNPELMTLGQLEMERVIIETLITKAIAKRLPRTASWLVNRAEAIDAELERR